MVFRSLNLTDKIFLYCFDSTSHLISTLGRAEATSNIKFFEKGNFTLGQLIDYLNKTHQETYYDNVEGFCLSKKNLKCMWDGKLRDLSKQEKIFSRSISRKFHRGWENEMPGFSLIAVGKDYPYVLEDLLEHEVSHSLFSLYPSYREQVLEIMSKHKTDTFHKWLLDIGYEEEVLEDECQAYHITKDALLGEQYNKTLHRNLRVVFLEHLDKHKISIEKTCKWIKNCKFS